MGSDSTVHPVTLERVRKVFGDFATNPLPKQLESTFDRQMGAAVLRHRPDPVPLAEIEGIKELMDHLWAPELTELSKILPDSATDLSVGAVEKLSSERPSSDDVVALNDSMSNSAAGEGSESGVTKLPTSSTPLGSLRRVDDRTIQIGAPPLAALYFRSDNGTYRCRRYGHKEPGGDESSVQIIAKQLFDKCRSPAVIDLLQQLGWSDVIDRYRAIESQAEFSQSVVERFRPPVPATVTENVETHDECLAEVDDQDDCEVDSKDPMEEALDALLARAVLIDKDQNEDQIIIEEVEIDAADGELLEWCGLHDVWMQHRVGYRYGFLYDVIDWCHSAYVERDQWDGEAPGMSGYMVTVTTRNPGKVQREIVERVRELL